MSVALCATGRQETRNDNVAITVPGRRRRYANTPAGCNWLSRRTRVARYALLGRTGPIDLQQFIFYTKYARDSNVFFIQLQDFVKQISKLVRFSFH